MTAKKILQAKIIELKKKQKQGNLFPPNLFLVG